jgi:hypothetical protein
MHWLSLPSIFFYLASVWNVVRELLKISKRCMVSRSSRLTATFVSGDLVFISSKIYIFTCMTNVLAHFTLLIKLAWLCASFNIIVVATFCLVAIMIWFLRHPLIKTNFNWLHLLCYDGHLAYSPWSISSTIDIFFEYAVPKWMLLEQTHVYEHIFVFLSSDIFFVTNFSNQSLCWLFYLDIFD